MHAKAAILALAALFACAAFGQTQAQQTSERVLTATHAQTPQDMQEIWIAIRSTAEIRDLSVDTVQRSVTVRGTPGQIAMAEWLFGALDVPPAAPREQPSATQVYQLTDVANQAARVFYLAHAATPRDLQEIVTTIRSTADIQRVFVMNSAKAVALRGTPVQLGMAEWLVSELDGLAGPDPHVYRVPGSEDVMRVFFLAHPANPQQVQEIVTLIRSVADIQRLCVYNAPRALALRTTAGAAAIAEWLVNELDRPAGVSRGQDTAAHQYRVPGSDDDLVRVFYLPPTDSPRQLQDIVTQMRTTTLMRRLFVYSAQSAVACRGTTGQMAQAERLIEERSKPSSAGR